MSKMRLVVVEIEGATESMLSVIRDVIGAREELSGVNIQMQPAAECAKVLAANPGLLYPDAVKVEAVKPNRFAKAKAAKPEAKQPCGTTQPEPPENENTCRSQVYAALKLGPKTSGELIKLLPKYSPASIYLALKELRASMVVKTEAVDGEQRNIRVTV